MIVISVKISLGVIPRIAFTYRIVSQGTHSEVIIRANSIKRRTGTRSGDTAIVMYIPGVVYVVGNAILVLGAYGKPELPACFHVLRAYIFKRGRNVGISWQDRQLYPLRERLYPLAVCFRPVSCCK